MRAIGPLQKPYTWRRACVLQVCAHAMQRSVSSVQRSVVEVSRAIYEVLFPTHIKLPAGPAELKHKVWLVC